MTAVEIGADTCAVARASAVRGDVRVAAVETLDPRAFPGSDAFSKGLRQARRALRLPRRTRAVVWGLPDGAKRNDPVVAPMIAPLVNAGFRIERVVTPCNALAALARLRTPRFNAATCWLAVNGGGVAIVAVRPGKLLYSHSFIWDSSTGSTGSQARLLQRYSLVSILAPEVKRAMAAARAEGTPAEAVITCGNLPDLRSLTMPLIEELDVEVETLDSLEGLIVKPPVAEQLGETAAGIRIACAAALARGTRPAFAKRPPRWQKPLAAAAVIVACLGLGWLAYSSLTGTGDGGRGTKNEGRGTRNGGRGTTPQTSLVSSQPTTAKTQPTPLKTEPAPVKSEPAPVKTAPTPVIIAPPPPKPEPAAPKTPASTPPASAVPHGAPSHGAGATASTAARPTPPAAPSHLRPVPPVSATPMMQTNPPRSLPPAPAAARSTAPPSAPSRSAAAVPEPLRSAAPTSMPPKSTASASKSTASAPKSTTSALKSMPAAPQRSTVPDVAPQRSPATSSASRSTTPGPIPTRSTPPPLATPSAPRTAPQSSSLSSTGTVQLPMTTPSQPAAVAPHPKSETAPPAEPALSTAIPKVAPPTSSGQRSTLDARSAGADKSDAARAASSKPLPPLLKDPLPRVTAILVAEDRRYATIDEGHIITIGDMVGRRVVVAIDERSVVLREPSGVQIRVGLGGRLEGIDRTVE